MIDAGRKKRKLLLSPGVFVSNFQPRFNYLNLSLLLPLATRLPDALVLLIALSTHCWQLKHFWQKLIGLIGLSHLGEPEFSEITEQYLNGIKLVGYALQSRFMRKASQLAKKLNLGE